MIPEAEWTFSVPLVEALVRSQFPERLGPVALASEGWDNAMFRLGASLAVRFPRRLSAVPLLEKELRWLPELAGRLPLPVPVPLGRGLPDETYPWPWTIQPWLAGETADRQGAHADQSSVLASFWRALHRPGPPDAPENPFRGGPLAERASALAERLERLGNAGWTPSPRLDRLWRESLAAPLDWAPVWIHADLHPRNVLVNDGRLAGVLDWGDLTVGDPAGDLAAAWMLLPDPESQAAALEAYGKVSEGTLRRSLGWAVVFGVMFLEVGLTAGEALTHLGTSILDRIEQYDRVHRGAP